MFGGEIVWEYVSFYFGKVLCGDVWSNWVYCVLLVVYDWVFEGMLCEEKVVNLVVFGVMLQVMVWC